MKMKEIAIFGAGGFGREIACIINQINQANHCWKFIGFFDDGIEINTRNEYGKILGGIEELNQWSQPLSVVLAIGNPKTLETVVGRITNSMIDFPNLIAPDVFLYDANSLKMGKGNIICPSSSISCNIKMGDFNLLNVFTQIGHDTELGSYNIVMPSVNISGGVEIGNCNLFGVKSTILQYKKVGNNVTITPGSVLSRNGKDGNMYLGNPAKVFM
jgi:sugar O-acyltransferase (sialic acid O-acetyltransferase NeuD family)